MSVTKILSEDPGVGEGVGEVVCPFVCCPFLHHLLIAPSVFLKQHFHPLIPLPFLFSFDG